MNKNTLKRKDITREDLSPQHFKTIKEYSKSSHDFRKLLQHIPTGDLYFFEFHEEIDWLNGNDPQYMTYVPVESEERADEINKLSLFNLHTVTPRIIMDKKADDTQVLKWIGLDDMRMHITPRLHKAIIFAATAHDFSSEGVRHYRKGTKIPYITHPFSVASIVAEYTADEDVVIAALFHDIIEDVEVQAFGEKEIRDQFGDKVFELVMHCTQQLEDNGGNWKERKLAYLQHLADTPDLALMIVAGDKVHNLMSILEDFKSVSYAIFDRFNAEMEDTLWFYQEVGKVIEQSNLPTEFYNRLKSLIDQLEEIITKK